MLKKIRYVIKEMKEGLSPLAEDLFDNNDGVRGFLETVLNITLPTFGPLELSVLESTLSSQMNSRSYISEIIKNNYNNMFVPFAIIGGIKTIYDIKRMKEGKSTVFNSVFNYIDRKISKKIW